jgi:hypothetical protein
MSIPLFVPLLLSAAPAPPAITEPDPPVQVWFDRDGNYDQGDRVRLFARAERDGYMVILHADLEGRVRVLFPLDPVQDDFVRGGQTLEILGRGEEGAFSIVQREGYGTVLAAWSPDPYYRDGLVRGDHWDYRVIAPNGVGDDAEAGLLEIVHAMAGNQRFEYHTAQYLVGYPVYESSPTYSISLRSNVCVGCSSWGRDYSRFGFSFSFGTPHWSIWYHDDPWYRPSYRRIHYYDPWRYSYGVPAWRPAYWYDPWYDPWWSWRPVRYYNGPRVAVGIRYGGCWDCGPRRGRQYRPGRATGVSFGDAYWTRGERGAATGIAWASGDGYRGPSPALPPPELPHYLVRFEPGSAEGGHERLAGLASFLAEQPAGGRLLRIGRASETGDRPAEPGSEGEPASEGGGEAAGDPEAGRRLAQRRVEALSAQLAAWDPSGERIEGLALGWGTPRLTGEQAAAYGLDPELTDEQRNRSVLVVAYPPEG